MTIKRVLFRIKAMLRQVSARIVSALRELIGRLVGIFLLGKCVSHFRYSSDGPG